MTLIFLIAVSTCAAAMTMAMLGARARCVMLEILHNAPDDISNPTNKHIACGLAVTAFLYVLTLWAA